MATEIKTYKKRPECAIPDCNKPAFIYVAGNWICGECCAKWNKSQNEKMFKDVVEELK